MSACSSSTAAPSIGADAATSANRAFVPAIGGDAEEGVSAITTNTEYDPSDPSAADGAQSQGNLASLLQQAQGLMAQLPEGVATTAGGGTGATAVTSAAPAVGAPGSFGMALAQRSAIQLQPMADGRGLMANLETIVQAREERLARLQETFLSDPNATPVDQQRLDQERRLLQDTKDLRNKLDTMDETIDAQEAAAVLQVIGAANQRGEFSTEQLAELLIQVEGSAHNLPASYLEKAMQAQELLEQTRADMDALIEQALAQGNGQVDERVVAELQAMVENQEATQEALRANFELAKRDPATATAQLDALAA